MDKPRFAFFGTPKLAVHVLNELLRAGLLPALIVTAPDKPQGRGMTLTAPPAKNWAEKHAVAIAQPDRIDEQFIATLRQTEWDVFIVAAYGKILPQELLDIPKHGTLNVHPSLLPRWRGASPVEAAILSDNQTGVTIMLLDALMDHGPIVAQQEVTTDTWPPKAADLEDKLATVGGVLLAETLPDWIAGTIEATEQNHDAATFCTKIKKEDGLIDLHDDPKLNFKKIQAYHDWPGAYFFIERNGKQMRVKITDAVLENDELIITRVTPEGKKEMDYNDFLRG